MTALPQLKGSPLPPVKKGAGGIAGKLEANKKPLMIAGAAAVAGLALLRRRAAGGDTTGTGAPAGFAGQSTSGGPYDSSGTDVYNALQPQIEQTQGMLATLLDRIGGGTVPGPTPTVPAATGQHNTSTAPGGFPTVTPRVPTPAPPTHTLPKITPRTPARPGPIKPKTTSYVVRKGDNLTVIAKRYGTSWSAIYAGNRGTIGANPNRILPGQRLTIAKK